MNYFLDTSALVKYYHNEAGSDQIISVIENPENKIWILDIARIEFICALYSRFRNIEISENELNTAIAGFNDSLQFFNVQETGLSVMQEAENLVKQFGKIEGLRTLDALHIAAFNLLADIDWIFAISDSRLSTIVKKIGHSVFNPIDK